MNENGSFWMPSAESTYAGDVDGIFHFVYYWSIFFLVIVVLGIVVFAVKYRRRKLEMTPDLSHNNTLELMWTAFPAILVMIVFVWGFKDYIKMTIVPKDAYEIKVTGQKWFWSFEYAEGATTVNELVVPAGRPIKLLMSSQDVIHCLYLPNFRAKRDVLPNRYSMMWFEAVNVGEFPVFCAEYCGTKHSEMIGKIRVLGETEFKDWLETSSASGEGMAPEEYGAKLYVSKACITCHSIDGKPGTGPSWKGIFGKQEHLADGSSVLVDENYIRESLLNPQAKVTAGYQPVMPTFQGILKDREIDAIIAYIKSLK
ncbi:cytochrome c oxidase subunit II [bacterium]|nr:cytochrome c oxidase subunit II [bacterium]